MKILIGALLILTFYNAHAHQSCGAALSTQDIEFTRRYLDRLEEASRTGKLGQEVTRLTVEYARGKAQQILEPKQEELQTLEKAYADSRACGNSVGCLLAQEKRARIGFSLLLKVFRVTAKSETEVKERLLAVAADRPALKAALDVYYNEKFFSGKKALDQFKAIPQLFRFEKLRAGGEEGEATINHWVKSTGTALGFQVTTHGAEVLPKFLSDPAFSLVRDTEWGVFLNTIFMMTLQAETGAKSTEGSLFLNPRDLTTLEGFVVNFPAILHGDKGYWRETKQTIGNFAALLPLDTAAMATFRLIKSYAVGEAQSLGQVLTSVGESSVSMSFFLSYLVLRWSFIDYKLSLRLGPAYQKGLIAERDALWSQFRVKHQLPEELSFEYYLEIRSQILDGKSKGKFTQVDALNRQRYYERYREALDKSFQSEELQEIGRWQSRIAWSKAGDYGWRIGFQTFDTLLLFKLLGEYVPATMSRVLPFIEAIF